VSAALAFILLNGALALRMGVSLVRRFAQPNAIVATDFSSYCTGWWMILHGQGRVLYDAASQRAAELVVMGGIQFDGGLMSFIYPPHAAVAGLPLGLLADRAGEPAAFAVWTAVNVVCVARLQELLCQTVGATGRERVVVLTALFAFYPVAVAVALGQLSIFIALAAFELYRAVGDGRDTASAAWLAALSVKPQLLPATVVWLAVRGRGRVLARAAGIVGVFVALSIWILGVRVWIDYVHNIRDLEYFFAPGPVIGMPNLRGALQRLLPASGQGIDPIVYGVWLASIAALAMWLRRRPAEPQPQTDYAVTVTVAILASPHLFQPDVALVAIPLALHVSVLRRRKMSWRPFAAFGLAWPALFACARIVDHDAAAPGRLRLPVDPIFVALVALLAVLVGGARPVSSRPAAESD
jgi:glycosyl transferase family 87